MKNFSHILYQLPLKFINMSNELYEIKVANDYSDYYITNNNFDISNNDYIDLDNKDKNIISRTIKKMFP